MGQADLAGDSRDGMGNGMDRSAELLKALPGFDGFRFDPLALIKAVNFFHTLGFAGSLRSLRLAGQMSAEPDGPDPDNILLVARALYVPVEAGEPLPRLKLGLADLEEPRDPELFPLFPLHLAEKLPLLLTGGYLAGGEGQPPVVYLDWCAGQARLRPAPLHPGKKPLAAVELFLSSSGWRRLKPNNFHPGMLRLQALRTSPQAYQLTEEQRRALLSTPQPTPFWLDQLEQEEQSKP